MLVIAFSGSLRRGSYNTQLLRAAETMFPPPVSVEIVSIREIPLLDDDVLTEHGVPDVVRQLKEKIAVADGLLLATPEYNNSLPGVAKNAIDWLSRPFADIPRVFGGLPVATIGVTPGRGGTILSQAAWLPVWWALGAQPWLGGRVQLSNAAQLFDENGLHDGAARTRLERFVQGFAEFVVATNRSGAR